MHKHLRYVSLIGALLAVGLSTQTVSAGQRSDATIVSYQTGWTGQISLHWESVSPQPDQRNTCDLHLNLRADGLVVGSVDRLSVYPNGQPAALRTPGQSSAAAIVTTIKGSGNVDAAHSPRIPFDIRVDGTTRPYRYQFGYTFGDLKVDGTKSETPPGDPRPASVLVNCTFFHPQLAGTTTDPTRLVGSATEVQNGMKVTASWNLVNTAANPLTPREDVFNSGGTPPAPALRTCQDRSAINVGGPLPCVYPDTFNAASCQDPLATNAGGALPCIYPRSPSSPPRQNARRPCVVRPAHDEWDAWKQRVADAVAQHYRSPFRQNRTVYFEFTIDQQGRPSGLTVARTNLSPDEQRRAGDAFQAALSAVNPSLLTPPASPRPEVVSLEVIQDASGCLGPGAHNQTAVLAPPSTLNPAQTQTFERTFEQLRSMEPKLEEVRTLYRGGCSNPPRENTANGQPSPDAPRSALDEQWNNWCLDWRTEIDKVSENLSYQFKDCHSDIRLTIYNTRRVEVLPDFSVRCNTGGKPHEDDFRQFAKSELNHVQAPKFPPGTKHRFVRRTYNYQTN